LVTTFLQNPWIKGQKPPITKLILIHWENFKEYTVVLGQVVNANRFWCSSKQRKKPINCSFIKWDKVLISQNLKTKTNFYKRYFRRKW